MRIIIKIKIKEGNDHSLRQREDGDSEKEKKHKAHKRSHKEISATWMKKCGEKHIGYKDHVKADKKAKLIEKYHTTTAKVHDSNVIEPFIDEKDNVQDLRLGAGAYIREVWHAPIVCEKSYKTHPLTEKQKKNHENSHSRCLIEPIFGFVERAMTGPLVRSIGMNRAKASSALTWLALLRHIVDGV